MARLSRNHVRQPKEKKERENISRYNGLSRHFILIDRYGKINQLRNILVVTDQQVQYELLSDELHRKDFISDRSYLCFRNVFFLNNGFKKFIQKSK